VRSDIGVALYLNRDRQEPGGQAGTPTYTSIIPSAVYGSQEPVFIDSIELL
jgi:hypothetical protein